MMHYENSLGFDLRVAVLPEGYDPDDLIREDPSAWTELVETAVHFVEYSIRTATQRDDIDDPRVKSQVVEELTPIINSIADSVMRAHYRQRLARALKIAENILFPQDLSVGNRSKSGSSKGRFKGGSAQKTATTSLPNDNRLTPTYSREAFCLAALIQYPRLIYKINRILAEYLDPQAWIRTRPALSVIEEWPDLEVLSPYVIGSDFAHPEHRYIFWVWNDALNQDLVEPMNYLLETLDSVTRSRVEGWLDQPLYALFSNVTPPRGNFTDEHAEEAAIQRLLDLRQKRLEDHIQDLNFLVDDQTQGGNSLTVHIYGNTISVLAAGLWGLQKRASKDGRSPQSPNQRLKTG
jgi:DnaB-helicase binding domain of primase